MPATDSVTMTEAEIERLAARVLEAAGARADAAASLARAIAAAEAEGIASHGLAYLPTYAAHLGCGKVEGQAEPVLTRPRPGMVAVDAGTGFAHPAIDAGLAALIPMARAQGVGALAIRNSYNCGVLGYHTAQLAAAGLVGLGFTNAPASIAPVGGHRPVIGTNPVSLAVPGGAGGTAILIDQSASVVAKSEVMKHAREGRPLPQGWALDPEGQPTTDPDTALRGTMAPAGGHKGVGIALITEVMAAALSGATLGIDAAPFSGTAGGPPRTGQFFLAIDPEAGAGAGFGAAIAALGEAIRAQPGARLPGEGRRAAREQSARDGIAVARKTLDAIEAIAG